MFVEQFMKRRFEEGRLQGLKEVREELCLQGRKEGREERDQPWRELLDALKSELERLGFEVELPATPPPPWAILMLVELFLKRRHEEGRLQGRRERDQEWREFLVALKSALARQGVEVDLLASPPSP